MTVSTDPPGHIHGRRVAAAFPLESGESILDFELSYATHGQPDAAGSNVVVVTTALGSTHHRLDHLIAPGRSLDPARWHTIAIDAIGNGRTTSPSTSRRQPGAQFPAFTIRDMVRSQLWLLDELGIDRVRCVVGASMGGMQALAWARLAPERVDAIVAMTPLVKTPPWTIAINDLARYLFAAAGEGLPGALGHALGLLELLACSTPEGLAATVGDEIPGPAIEALRDEREARSFSALDWVAQSRAYDGHDLAADDDRTLSEVLRSIDLPTLLLVPALDLFNPVSSANLAAATMPNATLITVPSPSGRGHQVTDGRVASEVDAIDRAIAEFIR